MSQDDGTRSGPLNARLDALFAAYREVCPELDPAQDFMPRLWQRIDASRSYSYKLKRFAQAIITAAAAVSLAMGLFLTRPVPQASPSYLELLAAGQARDNIDDTEIVQALHENSR